MKTIHKCMPKKTFAILMFCALVLNTLPYRNVSAQQDTARLPGYGLSNPVIDSNGVTTWDCIYFGNYWQKDTNGDGTANENDDKTPIKWRVLSVKDDDVFLLSDRNLCRQTYNGIGGDSTGIKWETSTLRSWLNGYDSQTNLNGQDYTNDNFLDDAFNASEQAAIAVTHVVMNDNPSVFPDNGNDTDDKIYLLSAVEIMKTSYGFEYTWNKSKHRIAKNTAFIDSSESTGDWWLRTLGIIVPTWEKVCYVDGEGRYWYADGAAPCSDLSPMVRPALHLNLSSLDSNSNLVWSYAGKITSNGEEIEAELPKPGLPTSSPTAETPKPATETPEPTATTETPPVQTPPAVTTPPEEDDGPIEITKISLPVSYTKLRVGDTYQIEADIIPANATDKTLTYESSDTSVLSVSETGQIEAIKEGTATVILKSANGKNTGLLVSVEGTREPSEQTPPPVETTPPAETTPPGEGYGLSNPVWNDSISTWDCIYFGHYWQNDTNKDGTADKNDEKEPIKWRVLSVNGDDVFLLSDQNLIYRPFMSITSDDRYGVTWETSTIRSWLNGYGASCNICDEDYTGNNFISDAFNGAERAAIADTTVAVNDNPHVYPDNGNDTVDKIFLLSPNETYKKAHGFEATWNKTKSRVATNTAFADIGITRWMLRTMGEITPTFERVCCIGAEGRLWINGGDAPTPSELGCMIRPALHLNLSSLDNDSNLVWSYAGKINSNGQEIEAELPKPGLPTSSPTAETPKPTTEPSENDGPIDVEKVMVSTNKMTMGVGEKVQLEASVYPKNASNKVLTYKTSNNKVTVNMFGKITAKKTGSCKITISSSNNKKAVVTVTVKKKPGKIKLNQKSKTLKVGKKFQIKPKLPKGTASYQITYTSKKKSVAAVSQTGKVIAKKKGTTVITVRTYNGKKATIRIRVK